jgi:hypothetical protein
MLSTSALVRISVSFICGAFLLLLLQSVTVTGQFWSGQNNVNNNGYDGEEILRFGFLDSLPPYVIHAKPPQTLPPASLRRQQPARPRPRPPVNQPPPPLIVQHDDYEEEEGVQDQHGQGPVQMGAEQEQWQDKSQSQAQGQGQGQEEAEYNFGFMKFTIRRPSSPPSSSASASSEPALTVTAVPQTQKKEEVIYIQEQSKPKRPQHSGVPADKPGLLQ